MNYSPLILSDYNGLYSLKGECVFAKRGELHIEYQEIDSDLGSGIVFSCDTLNVDIRWYKAKIKFKDMDRTKAVDIFESLFREMIVKQPMIAFINWTETIRYMAKSEGKQEVRSLIRKAMGYTS